MAARITLIYQCKLRHKLFGPMLICFDFNGWPLSHRRKPINRLSRTTYSPIWKQSTLFSQLSCFLSFWLYLLATTFAPPKHPKRVELTIFFIGLMLHYPRWCDNMCTYLNLWFGIQASLSGAMASCETWGTRSYAYEQALPTFAGPYILRWKCPKTVIFPNHKHF